MGQQQNVTPPTPPTNHSRAHTPPPQHTHTHTNRPFAKMNRLFGKAKEKTPDPTIAETIANTEARGESVDKKIRKLDTEIRGYGEQMRKMRPGRARDMVKQKAMR